MKYYNNCLFYNLQTNYIIQSGDPTATGFGGNSVYGILDKNKKSKQDVKYFPDEYNLNIKLSSKVGYIGMSHLGNQPNTNQSQFFITLRTEDMEHLKKEFTIFGELAEGTENVQILNELFCDENGRPYQDVRILHTYVLEDPFPDPDGFVPPDGSPERLVPEEEKVRPRIPYEKTKDPNAPTDAEEELDEEAKKKRDEEMLQEIRRKEAKSRAIVLEMTGDLPDADIKPPDEVLFVCKLNPVTRDEDLELIFSRFGKIKSCEIIRDFKTGDSLNYAFIEYEEEGSCIEAYEKMNNVLIDDRRIKVDFSQSVAKLWNKYLLKPKNTPNPMQNKLTSGGSQYPVKTEVKKEEDSGNSKAYSKDSNYEHKKYQNNTANRGGDRSRMDYGENESKRDDDRDGRYRQDRDRNSQFNHRGDSRDRNRGDRVRSRDRGDRGRGRDRSEREKDEGRSNKGDSDRRRHNDKDDSRDRKYQERDHHYREKDRDRGNGRERDNDRDRDRDRDGNKDKKRGHSRSRSRSRNRR
jgi:peptidyl-prolyl cis-trans isomerase-like 4